MAGSSSILSNFIWRFLERIGAQSVTFIVSLILARILDPQAYGTIALVLVFTEILNVFIDNGIGNSLIQKKDADDTDFSSVFYFNIVLCSILYLILYLAAPYISFFYKNSLLTPLLRVCGLTVIISGFKNIQIAYVSRHMQFKKFFFSTLGGTIVAAITGIVMALKGYGVWALVSQYLINTFIDTIILWITVPWRPKLLFSIKRLKSLISYGWKLLASSLLETVYTRARQLIIGKIYSQEDLAYYNKGDSFPYHIASNINSSINSILFPSMSAVQDEREKVKEITKKAITISAYVIMPMMAGLAACAPRLVSVLITDKWLPCVPYLQISCIIFAFYPLQVANLNAIKAVGRSDYYLKLEIIKKVVGITVLILTMRISVMAIALGLLASDFIDQIINSWPNKKLINYPYLEQIKDMAPSIIMSLAMAGAVYGMNYLPLFSSMKSQILALIIQIISGVAIYLLLSVVFKNRNLAYIMNSAKRILKRDK